MTSRSSSRRGAQSATGGTRSARQASARTGAAPLIVRIVQSVGGSLISANSTAIEAGARTMMNNAGSVISIALTSAVVSSGYSCAI